MIRVTQDEGFGFVFCLIRVVFLSKDSHEVVCEVNPVACIILHIHWAGADRGQRDIIGRIGFTCYGFGCDCQTLTLGDSLRIGVCTCLGG